MKQILRRIIKKEGSEAVVAGPTPAGVPLQTCVSTWQPNVEVPLSQSALQQEGLPQGVDSDHLRLVLSLLPLLRYARCEQRANGAKHS